MAIAAAAGLSRAAAETTTTTTWKCARKRNQYTTDGRTDGWTLVLKLAVTGSAVMCAGTASDDTTYTRVYLYT